MARANIIPIDAASTPATASGGPDNGARLGKEVQPLTPSNWNQRIAKESARLARAPAARNFGTVPYGERCLARRSSAHHGCHRLPLPCHEAGSRDHERWLDTR